LLDEEINETERIYLEYNVLFGRLQSRLEMPHDHFSAKLTKNHINPVLILGKVSHDIKRLFLYTLLRVLQQAVNKIVGLETDITKSVGYSLCEPAPPQTTHHIFLRLGRRLPQQVLHSPGRAHA
jgi:hypothetical protein